MQLLSRTHAAEEASKDLPVHVGFQVVSGAPPVALLLFLVDLPYQ